MGGVGTLLDGLNSPVDSDSRVKLYFLMYALCFWLLISSSYQIRVSSVLSALLNTELLTLCFSGLGGSGYHLRCLL